MLRTVEGEKKLNWKDYMAPLDHAYNSTRHAGTKWSPFFLMFGRQSRFPVDLVLGCAATETSPGYSNYVQNLRDNMKASYDATKAAANKARGVLKR